MEIMKVSIVMPTYNSMRTISECFDAIAAQDYPHNCLELVIADGGSTDGTLEFIQTFQDLHDIAVRVFPNALRTAEAGKAVGVRAAQHELICLLDSDNIIPDPAWMQRMTAPFSAADIVASEPISYTYRAFDSTVNRYCALIGMNDPLCLFTGNYDRHCLITNRWTNVPCDVRDDGEYLSIHFDKMLPTIGANGFLMRKAQMLAHFSGDYLFDIDVLWGLFQAESHWRVAKVKTGIIHLYCPDARTFYRKQNRRIRDYLYFNTARGRTYPWDKVGKGKIVLFGLSCITFLPLIYQAVIGYSRKQDAKAWAFHIAACWITLWVYGWGTIAGLFGKKAASRDKWKQ